MSHIAIKFSIDKEMIVLQILQISAIYDTAKESYEFESSKFGGVN